MGVQATSGFVMCLCHFYRITAQHLACRLPTAPSPNGINGPDPVIRRSFKPMWLMPGVFQVGNNADKDGSGFILRNNTILNHRARGMLIKARQPHSIKKSNWRRIWLRDVLGSCRLWRRAPMVLTKHASGPDAVLKKSRRSAHFSEEPCLFH